MTTICTLRHDGRRWIGSNSRGLVGGTPMPVSRTKWTTFGNWAVSFTGPGTAEDALVARRDAFPTETSSPFEVVEFMRKAFGDAEIGKEDSEGRDFEASGMLVHRGGKAFDFDYRFSIEPIGDGFWARGSGMDAAMGAASALFMRGERGEQLITAALEAAMACDAYSPGSAIIEEF